MCTLSMVHDHFNDKFPGLPNGTGGTGGLGIWPLQPEPRLDKPVLPPGVDLTELRQLIADFKEAVEAAKKVDALTNQKDCLDPEKAKLQERVDRLEKIIDALIRPDTASPSAVVR